MNTNPQAKVILCFGDSNTWGQNEDKGFGERYPVNVRWTGRLQQLLGTDYYVIEEGLGGRTVDLDDPRPEKPGRNGFDYFLPCFISHSRVDLAVIMLGTNDLKAQFSKSVLDIANSLNKYIETIRSLSPKTLILLVSPVPFNTNASKFKEYYGELYNEESGGNSIELAKEIQKVAKDKEVLFLEAGVVAKVGLDGLHLDPQSHSFLAEAVNEIIKIDEY